MKNPIRGALSIGVITLTVAFLVACGTPPAKNFKGSWRPVNHFRSEPVEIPLRAPYTYYAAPIDETLKTMLGRWASDTGRILRYELSYDVTLYKPVAKIRTPDVDSAVAQLNNVYFDQDVRVIVAPHEIVVRSAQSNHPSPPSTSSKTTKTPGKKP